MSLGRIKFNAGRATDILIQKGVLSPRLLGYRRLPAVSVSEYCQGSDGHLQEYSPATTVSCPLPDNVNRREDLSRDCGRYERSFYDVPDFEVGPSYSATINNCRILRNRNKWGDDFYAIVTADNQLLTTSGSRFLPEHAAALRRGRADLQMKKATWITTHSTRNHYMWLYTHLPRVLLAEQLGLADQILFPAQDLLSQVKQGTLSRLGYMKPNFVSNEVSLIEVEKLTLVEIDGFDPNALQILRQRLVGDSPSEPGNRIYVSRQKCHYRKLSNEAEVWPQLAELGFQKVFLEDLSLEAQITVLSSAEIVVGVHGAGFANILFCRPGTQIIEIQDPDDPNPHFYALAALLDLKFSLIHGQVDSEKKPHFRDVAFSINQITPLLEKGTYQ